jgi:protein-tyrosine phosphatase
MIDLHCHILPGIDDGPKDLDESLEMARIYVEAGYSQVVATPHQVPGTTWMSSIEDIKQKIVELNHALNSEDIELEVLPGMEIAFDPIIIDLLKNGELLTLGQSSYVLIEAPFQQFPLGWEQMIFAVLSKGYSILLAHPERCAQLAARPNLVDRMVESGIYFQVNWDSFLGYNGRQALRMARYMADKGYIHCLATDSHNPKDRHAAHVKFAAVKIKKLIGHQNLQIIASENPQRVLRGIRVLPMEIPNSIKKAKKESKWRFW